MGNALKKMAAEALKLPARSRARLAEALIASLEEVAEPEVAKAWVMEVARRSDELTTGKVKGISASKVFKHARAALR